jgi:hypothetical protein
MAQLSTDTLAYAQIINSVQTFISNFVENKNVSPKDFDTAYQKLISTIRKSITGPISKLDLINKGEIPSSLRFNEFAKKITDDINIINHQFDSLAANYVSSFNNLHDEIESEKSSMQRIRSKIGALELYSGSTSNNITYLGDLLNNMDLVDVNKSTTISVCDISDGIATLPKKDIKKWRSSISIYNKNFNNLITDTNFIGASNGLSGCNFLYSNQTLPGVNNPFLFQKDSTVIKSDPAKMIDESPVSFFEYEAISLDKNQTSTTGTRPAYEFHYYTGTGKDVLDWASFDSTKPLKLTVELRSSAAAGDYINYISLIPFFGYDATDLNAQIKNVQVTSIKLHNTNTADGPLEVINDGPVFIGADISGANISNYKNYFYNKGIFRFPETLANRVYITFEQSSFQEVTIKHAYWTPYDPANYQQANNASTATWHGQRRFYPEASGVLPAGSTSITWNQAAVIPTLEDPNRIKSNTNESVKIDLTYLTTSTVSTPAMKLTKSSTASEFAYFYNKQTLGGIEFYIFKSSASSNISETVLQTTKGLMTENTPCVFLEDNKILQDVKIDIENVSITAAPSQVITIKCLEKHGLLVGGFVFMNGIVSTASFNGVYTVASKVDDYTFTVVNNNTETLPVLALQAALTLACYPCYTKVTLDSTTPTATVSNLSIITVTTNPSKNNTESIWLKRNYEYLTARRASLGIRDIFLGKEIYLESAEIISKPFYVSKDVDLLSLEVGEYVPQSNESATSIDYYISVDDGLRWIQVSPMKKNFVGVPEILSFNQNLDNTNLLPQIAYYNSPEIPNTIKSIRFRAIMKKTKNGNSTPVLGSYKIGIRFK